MEYSFNLLIRSSKFESVLRKGSKYLSLLAKFSFINNSYCTVSVPKLHILIHSFEIFNKLESFSYSFSMKSF